MINIWFILSVVVSFILGWFLSKIVYRNSVIMIIARIEKLHPGYIDDLSKKVKELKNVTFRVK